MTASSLNSIGRYLKRYRGMVVRGVIALVVVNIFSVIIPLEVRRIIDELQYDFAIAVVTRQAVWIILLATVMGGVRLYSRQLIFGVGRQVELDLRQELFDHMLRQEPRWVQRTGSGEVISRATSDVENIRRLMGFAVLSLTNTALAYSLTIPAMLAIDPGLTIAAIALYPLMLIVVRLLGGKMMRQQRNQQEALSSLSDLIQEDLSGISAIKIYGQEHSEKKAFNRLNNIYCDAAIVLSRTRSTLFPLLEGIASLSLLLLLAIGSTQISRGSLSIGSLVALILYVERLVFPTALLGFTLNTFQTGQVSLERVEELLGRSPIIRDTNNLAAPPTPLKGRLEARGLCIRYDDSNQYALHGLSFQIKPGEVVAVVGPIGCGKTTLARALGRMVEVPRGQLLVDGIDCNDLPLETLRGAITLVPQEGYLFTSSLADNLRYGEPSAGMNRVEQAAKQACLLNDVRGFPEGFETLVGERGITLSGGQRQRSALARALLVSAPVLVLDDALASVDNATAAAILASIRAQSSRTILMISHQLSAAAACDRILVVEKGRLVQQGCHEELINQQGIYQQLWKRQQLEQLSHVNGKHIGSGTNPKPC